MSRLDSLGLLLKDIYPCKLVLFFPSFADIKPPFNLQAGFDIRCIHLFNILFTAFVMNSYQMIFEMAVLRKISLAHRTLKWPLTSVGLQVPFQLVRPRKRFLTHVTFEGFLARMDTHVVFDFIFTGEWNLAHVTFILFLNNMGLHVAFQLIISWETSFTKLTLKWFLNRVRLHVVFKFILSQKTSLTNITFERHCFSITDRFVSGYAIPTRIIQQ